MLGHTTGSHLELPDEEEVKLTLIWVADVVDGLVHTWRLEPDTIERRAWYGIALTVCSLDARIRRSSEQTVTR